MHAYLIVAHKNFEQLKLLISLLDYPDNEIFLHIDKKADKDIINFNFSTICKYSCLHQFSEFNINWGSSNMIKCELFLLESAIKVRKFDYYHLLSGLDLPLCSQSKIHQFFNSHKGKEFIHFSSNFDSIDKNIEARVKYYWISDYYHILPFNSFKIMRKIDKIQVHFQQLFGINRLKKNNIRIYKGANWFSITHKLANELVKNKKDILNLYKNSYCCDEVFLQTFVMNNDNNKFSFYKCNDSDDYSMIMRYIDWNRGGPYVWHKTDFSELIDSNYLFARKFDEKVDNEIINMLYYHIKGGDIQREK